VCVCVWALKNVECPWGGGRADITVLILNELFRFPIHMELFDNDIDRASMFGMNHTVFSKYCS